MALVQDFERLGKELSNSYVQRINFVDRNKANTKEQLHNFRTIHHIMGKKLHNDLYSFRKDLIGSVHDLLAQFHKRQLALHHECVQEHNTFVAFTKTMTNLKKHHFSSAV